MVMNVDLPKPVDAQPAAYASWTCDGNAWLLNAKAANVREALSPVLWLFAGAVGIISGVVAAGAGASMSMLILAALLSAGTALSFGYYVRLSLLLRDVRLTVAQDYLGIDDGRTPQQILPFAAIKRIVFVHDGTPSKIVVESEGRRFRWVIGQVHRNNRVERYIAAIPAEVRQLLQQAGLREQGQISRKIHTTAYVKE